MAGCFIAWPCHTAIDRISQSGRSETLSVHTIAPRTKLTVSIGRSDGIVEFVAFFEAERGVA